MLKMPIRASTPKLLLLMCFQFQCANESVHASFFYIFNCLTYSCVCKFINLYLLSFFRGNNKDFCFDENYFVGHWLFRQRGFQLLDLIHFRNILFTFYFTITELITIYIIGVTSLVTCFIFSFLLILICTMKETKSCTSPLLVILSQSSHPFELIISYTHWRDWPDMQCLGVCTSLLLWGPRG